jgi:transcriptional regulator with XRE-family HTH domain
MPLLVLDQDALMPARSRAIGPAVSQRAGRNIRRERKFRDWTLTELSFRMTEVGYRLSPATIRQVERGSTEGRGSRIRPLSVDEAWAFSEVLGVSLMLLLQEDSWDDTESAGGSGGSSPL